MTHPVRRKAQIAMPWDVGPIAYWVIQDGLDETIGRKTGNCMANLFQTHVVTNRSVRETIRLAGKLVAELDTITPAPRLIVIEGAQQAFKLPLTPLYVWRDLPGTHSPVPVATARWPYGPKGTDDRAESFWSRTFQQMAREAKTP